MVLSLGAAFMAVFAHGMRTKFGTPPTLTSWGLVGFVVATLLLTAELLRRHHRVATVALLPVVAIVMGLPPLAYYNGGLNAPILSLATAIPILATFFLGTRRAILIGAVVILEIVGLAMAAEFGWAAPRPMVLPLAKGGIIVIFVVLNLFIASVYEIERKHAEGRLRALAAELYQASIRDPLTQAFNRRHFAERLAEELAYARRHDTYVGVLVLDADHFKRVNDTHGHKAGDVVLQGIARLLREATRAEDIVARYGGEEFVVLLRDARPNQAALVAERIRRSVAGCHFEHQGTQIAVTVSVGTAAVQGAEAREETLLPVADSRLYAAKSAGRNCVVSDGLFTMPDSHHPIWSGRPRHASTLAS